MTPNTPQAMRETPEELWSWDFRAEIIAGVAKVTGTASHNGEWCKASERDKALAQIEALNELLEPALIELENVKECASRWELRNEELVRELAAAKRDGERLADALAPFVKFNSSENKITLGIDTACVREGRAAIANYCLREFDAFIEQGGRGNG